MFGIIRAYAYLLASFKVSLRYRANVWMQIIGVVLLIVIQFFLWKNIENKSSLLNGLEINSILFYVVLSRLLVFIIPGINTTNFISQKILKGTISIDLLRPIQIQLSAFFNELGKLLYSIIFIIFPSVIICYIFLDIPIVKVQSNILLMFIISLVFAYILAFQLSFMIGTFSIWFGNIWGVREFYEALLKLLGGSLIPISLYPNFLQTVAIYSPFQSIYFTPLSFISGMDGLINYPIAIQIIWILVFGSLNTVLLRYVLKKAVIQGG